MTLLSRVEALTMRTRALQDVVAERRRQIKSEGWTLEHDDFHDNGQLAAAAAAYITKDVRIWPWADEWWKATDDERRNFVKAGALILAEIERLDRKTGCPDAAIASVLEDDWQTMETAPKDVWIEAWRPPTEFGFWQSCVRVRWYRDEDGQGESGWVWPDGTYEPTTPAGQEHAEEQIEEGNFFIDKEAFTHWRPLPSPPKAGE